MKDVHLLLLLCLKNRWRTDFHGRKIPVDIEEGEMKREFLFT